MSDHITSDLTGRDLAAHWQQYLPEPGSPKLELVFDYPASDGTGNKERCGIIERITTTGVTLLLERDGQEHYSQDDKMFKTFNFDRIVGDIDVFRLG